MSASRDPRRFNPLRTPDWRWRRATELLMTGRRPLHWEDPAIQRARVYQRDMTIKADFNGIVKRLPEVAAAHALYRAGGMPRAEVEARLLAGESPAVIAAKASVSVEAVVGYEAYFFNVAHCLQARDWLMTHAVFPGPGRTIEERHVWCYWALAGGPAIVDLLVADDARAGKRLGPRTPAQADHWRLKRQGTWYVSSALTLHRRSRWPLYSRRVVGCSQWEQRRFDKPASGTASPTTHYV